MSTGEHDPSSGPANQPGFSSMTERPGTERPGTSADAVDVVVHRLDVGSSQLGAFEKLLTRDERARAGRVRQGDRRAGFIVGRGHLRVLLGQVLGCRPDAVPIVDGRGEKPRLDETAQARVRFSVAHSAQLVLCALAMDHDIGVDVEHEDDAVEWEAIAARVFTAAERAALGALHPDARRGAFFDGWTRKEAVIKATGEGLRRPLTSFAVSVEPHRAAMLSCDPALGTPESWVLAPVPVPLGYRAAVAVRGRRTPMSLRLWP
jgi:4'-phosphopantetheinyl transferase